MEADGTVLGKNRILDPVIEDGMDAARTLQRVNDGHLVLTDQEELALMMRIGEGLDGMKIKALLADPERYERHFLS